MITKMIGLLRAEVHNVIMEFASREGADLPDLQQHATYVERRFFPVVRERLQQAIDEGMTGPELYKVLEDLAPQLVPSGEVFAVERNPLPTSQQPDKRWENSTNALSDQLSRLYIAWVATLRERLEQDNRRKSRKRLGIFPVSGHEIQIVDKSLQDLREDAEKVLAEGLMGSVLLVEDERTPEATAMAIEEIMVQKQFLLGFIVAARAKIMSFLEGDQVDDLAPIIESLGSMQDRLVSYAGAKWKLIQGLWAEKLRKTDRRVAWVVDDQAVHCETCAKWGGRVWDSMDNLLAETGGVLPGMGECMSKCRCSILGSGPGGAFVRE